MLSAQGPVVVPNRAAYLVLTSEEQSTSNRFQPRGSRGLAMVLEPPTP